MDMPLAMVDAFDRTLESAMCDHWWVPNDVHVVCRPEIEYLHSQRNSSKCNAVIRVDPGLADYQGLVEEFLTIAGRTHSEWRIGAPSYTKQLEQSVLRAGYALETEADAWSLAVTARRPCMPDNLRVESVTTIEQLKGVRSVFISAFDRFDEDELPSVEDEFTACMAPGARSLRFLATDKHSGEPLACAMLDIFPALGIGFMWGGATIESARGKGYYSALITERLKAAERLGLERVGLYALRKTSGIIIEKQGFKRHGPCYFWM